MEKFLVTETPEPHKERTRTILSQHPEIRQLFGKNAATCIILLACVAAQFFGAWWLRDKAWGWSLVAGWCVGAFVVHALFVTIHEAAHNLIFKAPWANKLAAVVANLPSVIPSAISFRQYHLKHHAHQGHPSLDADLPFEWEARWVGNRAWRKALWLFLFPVFQALRPVRIQGVPFLNAWVLFNWFTTFGATGLVLYFWGWNALAYLFFSFLFSIGLHPLGARWIQEHYLVAPPQETYSYYGPLNSLQMNIGYHNEHHDFPSVPWNKLPEVRRLAPEFYDTLYAHTSWTGLLWRFITDSRITLYSRAVRYSDPRPARLEQT
ncbi:MAG: fatty acid desaturase [Flavobacteriales bacterium]|nr:fatty acid desaturase [Flavobacteriales bacterium]MCX7649230.1 fatty acid desaturase [Flavobacteriales bacterium]MDW8431957.1 fatty acid desaturase [Flavobacteriales bacterium]